MFDNAPGNTASKVALTKKLLGEVREAVGKPSKAKPESSGLHGTQNKTNLDAINANKQAKPKGGGGHGVSALLGPAFIAAAMLAASTKAKAEGLDTTGQVKEAAKEGAKSTAVIAGFGAGTAIAVKGLMKAGLTAVKAIPAVNIALMAGNAAYEGGSAAMQGASGQDIAKAAARGAWDMSLPGMALNAASAVKEAVAERAALNAQPARQNTFATANKAYKAIQHAKAATGNHLKGFQNPATLAAALAAQGKTVPKSG